MNLSREKKVDLIEISAKMIVETKRKHEADQYIEQLMKLN